MTTSKTCMYCDICLIVYVFALVWKVCLELEHNNSIELSSRVTVMEPSLDGIVCSAFSHCFTTEWLIPLPLYTHIYVPIYSHKYKHKHIYIYLFTNTQNKNNITDLVLSFQQPIVYRTQLYSVSLTLCLPTDNFTKSHSFWLFLIAKLLVGLGFLRYFLLFCLSTFLLRHVSLAWIGWILMQSCVVGCYDGLFGMSWLSGAVSQPAIQPIRLLSPWHKRITRLCLGQIFLRTHTSSYHCHTLPLRFFHLFLLEISIWNCWFHYYHNKS